MRMSNPITRWTKSERLVHMQQVLRRATPRVIEYVEAHFGNIERYGVPTVPPGFFTDDEKLAFNELTRILGRYVEIGLA